MSESFDLDETRSKLCRSSYISVARELAGPLDQRRNRQPIRKPSLLKRKLGREISHTSLVLWLGDGHGGRQVLAADINNRVLGAIDLARDGELKLLAVRRWRAEHIERAVSGQSSDGAQLERARIRNDERLDRREGEVRVAAGEERRRGRELGLHVAEKADLLAFLREHGADQRDQAGFITGVGGEGGLSLGEGAEDDVGECLREGDGAEEGADGELIGAGGHGSLATALENAVDAQGVQFFLLERDVRKMLLGKRGSGIKDLLQ